MRTYLGLALLTSLLLGRPASAQTPEIQDKVNSALDLARRALSDLALKVTSKVLKTDYIEGIFFASDRPVLLRVHFQVNGRPYFEVWDSYFNQLFDYFDLNKDGTLSKEEAEHCPNVNFLQQHLSGSLGFGQQNQTVKMAEIDTNKDGKVTREEFMLYYVSAFPPVRFNSNNASASADRVNDVIFRQLTGQKDGKLTAENLAKARTAFARLDDNEDELISRAELLQNDDGGYGPVPVVGYVPSPMPANQPLVQLIPGQPLDAPIRQILATYAKADKSKVSRAEIGLPKELFDELDTNKDNHLDAAELVKFLRRDPDLELMIKVGKNPKKEGIASRFVSGVGAELGYDMAKEKQIELFSTAKKPMPVAGAFRAVNASSVDLLLGDAKIELNAAPMGQVAYGRVNNVKQYYVDEFHMVDTEKKNVLDRKQIAKSDFLKDIFRFADRDNDGKLTLQELIAWLDLQAIGSSSSVAMNMTEQGRDLFHLIDANHDGQISQREWLEAWPQLQALAKDGQSVSRTDIPRRFQADVSLGNTGYRNTRVGTGPKIPKGPLWFRKMDRNGDGDISLKEWLGTEDQFRRIDENGDGLISVAEAERFDAKMKKDK